MSKATESMFDGKNVLIPLAEVSYILKFPSCIEVRFKDSAGSLTLAQPDKNAFISAWCRYRGEVEADTLMDLDGTQPAPSFADAYQGAMEEVAIWKMRALEAEDLNRKFIAEKGMFLREAQAYKQDWNECRTPMIKSAQEAKP